MVPEISVRELKESESADALLLVWDVFMEYEAPDYSEEGIAEFYKSIQAICPSSVCTVHLWKTGWLALLRREARARTSLCFL